MGTADACAVGAGGAGARSPTLGTLAKLAASLTTELIESKTS